MSVIKCAYCDKVIDLNMELRMAQGCVGELREELEAAEQRAVQEERDAVRECERIARSYEPVEMSDIPYASTDIRNRYPQHFGDD